MLNKGLLIASTATCKLQIYSTLYAKPINKLIIRSCDTYLLFQKTRKNVFGNKLFSKIQESRTLAQSRAVPTQIRVSNHPKHNHIKITIKSSIYSKKFLIRKLKVQNEVIKLIQNNPTNYKSNMNYTIITDQYVKLFLFNH